GSVLPRHKFGFNFFRTSVWDPIFEQFGALPFIYGTLVTAAVSLLIAVPLGIGAAIFLAELAPARVSDTLEFFIDLLAAVPAVIANEFTEATGDLHTESLIELGLVLFILTFVLNGFARLLIVATSQRGSGRGQA